MLEAGVGEGAGVVVGLVEADDGGDAELAEDVDVAGRAEVANALCRIIPSNEALQIVFAFAGDKLARDDLVKIAVERDFVHNVPLSAQPIDGRIQL